MFYGFYQSISFIKNRRLPRPPPSLYLKTLIHHFSNTNNFNSKVENMQQLIYFSVCNI